jgi:hypothetical protein
MKIDSANAHERTRVILIYISCNSRLRRLSGARESSDEAASTPLASSERHWSYVARELVERQLHHVSAGTHVAVEHERVRKLPSMTKSLLRSCECRPMSARVARRIGSPFVGAARRHRGRGNCAPAHRPCSRVVGELRVAVESDDSASLCDNEVNGDNDDSIHAA